MQALLLLTHSPVVRGTLPFLIATSDYFLEDEPEIGPDAAMAAERNEKRRVLRSEFASIHVHFAPPAIRKAAFRDVRTCLLAPVVTRKAPRTRVKCVDHAAPHALPRCARIRMRRMRPVPLQGVAPTPLRHHDYRTEYVHWFHELMKDIVAQASVPRRVQGGKPLTGSMVTGTSGAPCLGSHVMLHLTSSRAVLCCTCSLHGPPHPRVHGAVRRWRLGHP